MKINTDVVAIENKIDRPDIPTQLIIPSINVNAKIQQVGVTKTGEMQTPSNANDAGWFKFGARPGELGSTVIAGHFNDKNGEIGIFSDLSKMTIGDKVVIIDDKGKETTFTVYQNRIYDSGYADEVFGLSDNAYLNLVTCDGDWDANKKSYSKRLVVFTKIDK